MLELLKDAIKQTEVAGRRGTTLEAQLKLFFAIRGGDWFCLALLGAIYHQNGRAHRSFIAVDGRMPQTILQQITLTTSRRS